MSSLKDSTIDGDLTVNGLLTVNNSNFRLAKITITEELVSNPTGNQHGFQDFDIKFNPPFKSTNYGLLSGAINFKGYMTSLFPCIVPESNDGYKTNDGCLVRAFFESNIAGPNGHLYPGLELLLLFIEF